MFGFFKGNKEKTPAKPQGPPQPAKPVERAKVAEPEPSGGFFNLPPTTKGGSPATDLGDAGAGGGGSLFR